MSLGGRLQRLQGRAGAAGHGQRAPEELGAPALQGGVPSPTCHLGSEGRRLTKSGLPDSSPRSAA